MKTSQLKVEDYNPYYQTYVNALGEVNLLEALNFGLEKFTKLVAGISDEKWNYSYAEGKWTIADVLLHIIDTERVFQYRALCFSRNDKTALPGFDQDDYVANTNANHRSKESVLKEFLAVRNSTIALYSTFSENDLLKRGVASNSPMNVAALGFILSGHLNHHISIIEERYL